MAQNKLLRIENQTITIQQAQQIWAKCLGTTDPVRMLPADILQAWAQLQGAEIQQSSIPDWPAFESGEHDLTADDWAMYMGLAKADPTQWLYLVTDEGWKDKVAFRLKAGEFAEFVDGYESHYQMDFFQSADYILFPEDLAFAHILHHEGVVFVCTRALSTVDSPPA